MAINPSSQQIKASKLIESFGSFFEKIANISQLPIQNNNKLLQLKKMVYENIDSQANLALATDDFLKNVASEPKSASKIPRSPVSNFESLQRSDTKELSSSSQTPVKAKSEFTEEVRSPVSQFNANPTTNVLSLAKESVSYKNMSDSSDNKAASSSMENMPVTSFLTKIKAASHEEMSKLFAMTSNYIYARSFAKTSQPIFKVLCLSFFEKILKENIHNMDNLYLNNLKETFDLEEDLQLSERENNEYAALIKDCAQSQTDSDIAKKLFEKAANIPILNQSLLSIFKQLISKFYSGKLKETIAKGYSYEWIEDINGGLDQALYQNLASQVFRCNMKVLILTQNSLIEKFFTDEKTEIFNSKKTITIFYDQSSHWTYILYPLRKHVEDDSPSYQKLKVKLNLNQFNKPPLSSEYLKSLKSVNGDANSGTLTTLDTNNASPLTSLNEIENKDKNRERNTQLKCLSSRGAIKKAGTLNVFTSSLQDVSGSAGHPDSAAVKSTTNKIETSSPISAQNESKSLNQLKSNDNEIGSLVPKDKEPVPQRSTSSGYTSMGSSISNSKVPPAVDEKLFNMIYEKTKNEALAINRQHSNPLPEYHSQLSERNRDRTGRLVTLDRYSTQEYSSSRAGDSRLRTRGDYASIDKNYSVDFSRKEYASTGGVVSAKSMALPNMLKTKFDKFNYTVNQNDQEMIKVANKYLNKIDKSSSVKGKGNVLNSLINVYNGLIRTKDMTSRPSVGTALRMDDR